MQAIKSIQELQRLCANDMESFYMLLNGGCRSSKDISYYPKSDSWCMTNCIDDSIVDYVSTDDFVKNEPLIVKAMAFNAFFKY